MDTNIYPLWIGYLIIGVPVLLMAITFKVTGDQNTAFGAGALGAVIGTGIVWKILTSSTNQDPTTDSEAI